MEKKQINKKFIYVILCVITVAVIVCAMFLRVFLTKSHRLIKVIQKDGTVTVERANTTVIDAYIDMVLQNEDTVKTSEDSRLYLQLDSDKYVELMPESVMHIVAEGDEEKGNTKTRIVLDEGSVINEIQTHLGVNETFDVDTPCVSIGVRGTKFKVEARLGDTGIPETYIEVEEGTVEAYRDNEGATVMIAAGFRAIIKENQVLSDVIVEEIGIEEIPYIEFGVDINDIKVLGRPYRETSIEWLMEYLGINNKEASTINDSYVSDNGMWQAFFVKNPEGRENARYVAGLYYIDGGIAGSYTSIEYDWREEYFYGIRDAFDSNLDESYESDYDLITWGNINKYTTKNEMKQIFHIDELQELLTKSEDVTASFMCNWSDELFSFEMIEDEEETKYFLRPANRENDYLVLLVFRDNDFSYWQLYSN